MLKAGEVDNTALDNVLICRVLPRLTISLPNKETCTCQKIKLEQYYVLFSDTIHSTSVFQVAVRERGVGSVFRGQ